MTRQTIYVTTRCQFGWTELLKLFMGYKLAVKTTLVTESDEIKLTIISAMAEMETWDATNKDKTLESFSEQFEKEELEQLKKEDNV